MRPRAALCHGLLGAVWFVATIFATDAHAGTDETEETEETVEYEFSGRLSAESRWFPEAGAFPASARLPAASLRHRDSIWKTPTAETSRWRRSFATIIRTRAAPRRVQT